jgi:integrase
MRAKITKRLVEGLKPRAKMYAVRDTELPGFMLRVRPSGRMTWFFDYRNEAGRRLKYKIGGYPGLQPEGARQLAKEAAGKVAARVDVQAVRQAARAEAEREKVSTLVAFIEHRYGPWALAHLRRGDAAAARLKADFAKWLDEPLTTFNPWRLKSWRRDRLKEGIKPNTLNRQIDTLRAALRKGVEWGVIDTHPLAGLKRLKVDDDERVRFLTPAEETRLREALVKRETRLRDARDRFNAWRAERHRATLPARAEEFVDRLRPLVFVALNTGLRRGELFLLRWSDIDLDHSMLTVRSAAAKSGDSRRVPLNTEALGVLKGWKKQTKPHSSEALVFPGDGGARLTNVNKSWQTLRKLAKLVDFRFHDLRHTFASKLVQRGVDLNTVRALMGHADLKMTLRYSHLAPDNLAAAVAKLG